MDLRSFLLSSLLVASCFASAEQDFALEVMPSKPIVFSADTVTNNGKRIRGPWFSFQTSLDNKAANQISVTAVSVYVQSEDANGTLVETEYNFSPDSFNFSYTCADGSIAQIQYSDFGVFEIGQSGRLHLTDRQALPPACNNQMADGIATFYVGGIPANASGSYSHKVRAKIAGWYGSLEHPRDRFEKFVDFVTQ